MAFYQLATSPDLMTKEVLHAYWENGFSDSETLSIRILGDSLTQIAGSVGAESGAVDLVTRKSQVGWIGLGPDSNWIYDKLGFIARQLNGQFFDFALDGFLEDLQYTVYSDGGDHYDWHMDRGSQTSAPRKLSMVLQLSDPSEYEGGDLQFLTGRESFTAEKRKGIVYVFPSFLLHRVTPVTRGTRRSLVAWLVGPKFR